MRLNSQRERDQAVRELVETTAYVDEHGEPVDFDQLPAVHDAEGDADADHD
jgi:hypothetical protein